MLGYQDNECVSIFNNVINESIKLNGTFDQYLNLKETGDTKNQTNYVALVIRGKVSSLNEEANFILNKCHSSNSHTMFRNFLSGWHSSFDTMLYVYQNNIYNRKSYNTSDNLIIHSKQELSKYFNHFKDCSDVYCPEMVVIPPGSFMMGGTENEEYPKHMVNIKKSFAIGIHEVTIQQFLEFVKVAGHIVPNGGSIVVNKDSSRDTPYLNNINYNNPNGNGKLNIYEPVTCLRKEDTRLFIRWLSSKTNQTYRLPTEAEWEYVARSNYYQFINYNETACHYENVYDKISNQDNNKISFKCNDNSKSASSVASYLPNGFGIYDLMGNVKEWVDDCWHNDLIDHPTDGSSWSRENNGLCSYGVYKGGCFESGINEIKISMRNTLYSSQMKSNTIGFRLVREL